MNNESMKATGDWKRMHIQEYGTFCSKDQIDECIADGDTWNKIVASLTLSLDFDDKLCYPY